MPSDGWINKNFTVRDTCPYTVKEMKDILKAFFTFIGQYKKDGKQLFLDILEEEFPSFNKAVEVLKYLLGEKEKERDSNV